MKISISGLYGVKAWYRKQGRCCYDFVDDKRFASELDAAEIDRIMKNADSYLDAYNADQINVEE